MFNSNFYPTPFSLVQKMLEWVDFSKPLIVLEPSAGKGDIAKAIKNKNERSTIHLIEIEPELQAIAKQYGDIVANDFLAFEPDTQYDLIVMNPPFDNGDDHLLKAWEIAKNTTIICLLNAETIRNPYSSKRKALHAIIEQFGSVEYIQGAFLTAERSTGVEVALVRITKTTKQSQFFKDFEEEEEREYKSLDETALATPDRIGNIIEDFKRANDLYAQGVALIEKADKISKQYIGYPNGFENAHKERNIKSAVVSYANSLRSGIWQSIFSAMKLDKYMTTTVLEAFNTKMREQKSIAINKANIEMFIETLFQNSGKILEESISSVFDNITRYNKNNKQNIEGWVHNEAYMVGKKFVLPGIEFCTIMNKMSISYGGARSRFEDIDKALCYLTGTRYEDCNTIVKSIEEAMRIGETKCESTFFNIVFYKKGTIHLTFRSKKVWIDFNIRATDGKWGLPPDMANRWRQKNKF